MANRKYLVNKCDHGKGMNWCVIRLTYNEHGGDNSEVVRYTHTRDVARDFVAASKVADSIPAPWSSR